jgi:flagellar basal-body rod protein FlgF
MQTSLYVGLSGQMALQKRMDTLAHNIANAQTPGFRAETVNFRDILAKAGDESVAFVDSGREKLSTESGEIKKTDNPLDVAVRGEGWFGLSAPGGTVYTRDGRLLIDASGTLRSVRGYAVQDAGNAPITVDPSAGPISISQDGMLTQSGKQIGAIGLFRLPPDAQLTRYDNSAVQSSKPGEPALDFTSNGVLQGFLESSNVDPASEMIQLITVSRAFEAVTNASETTEGSVKDAIKTLG